MEMGRRPGDKHRPMMLGRAWMIRTRGDEGAEEKETISDEISLSGSEV